VSDRSIYIIGGGIAGLAAAVFLIRDGGVRGERITIFEEDKNCGGSLDASGAPTSGYLMRGERMFSKYFDCIYDLLSEIPSYDNPQISARDDIFNFTREAHWNATTRLIDKTGKSIDLSSMGFDNSDRFALLRLLLRSEQSLGATQIQDVFPPHFFTTNFWFLWRTMFAFQPWHSAAEMRRYLLHFIYAFPTITDMSTVHLTRYTQYHSIVAPIVRWLDARGVIFENEACVQDIEFHSSPNRHQVKSLRVFKGGAEREILLSEDDFVIFTNGSMTAASTLGSMSTPARLERLDQGASWALWKEIAANRTGLGKPEIFTADIDKSKWLSFTATTSLSLMRELVEKKTGITLGRAGLLSFKESSWLLTLKFNYYPVYPGQPKDAVVWWGYGLNPDREGDFVKKKMVDCTGEDLLRESFMHLGFGSDLDTLMQHSTAIPCMMPYITSQFMPRKPGDRPKIIPDGSINFAFIGQFCETPDDTVFTVEYSVRTAKIAVKSLLKSDMQIPPFYKSWRNPGVLWRALKQTFS
jgi:oleate hydratase